MKRLKLCIIGDPDSIHVRRWLAHFADRGFAVAALAYRAPREELDPRITVRSIQPQHSSTSRARGRLPDAWGWPSDLGRAFRFLSLWRGGFYPVLEELEPDVIHAHYLSSYGFAAAVANQHPLVVSAWGSDVLVDPFTSPLARWAVGKVLRAADLVTYDAGHVADVALRLGARRDGLLRVVLGVDSAFIQRYERCAPPPRARPPIILSLRALTPLYNVEVLVRAMPQVLPRIPGALLIIGNDGPLRSGLARLASTLGVAEHVRFVGAISHDLRLADCLATAAVYVSVPSSDGTSVTLLEAMAAGAYPIVSDLPANREWVDADGGAILPAVEPSCLSAAIVRALLDPDERARAAARNWEVVLQHGLWENNMATVEDAYYRLAGAAHP